MNDSTQPTTFQRKLAERRAAQEAARKKALEELGKYEDLVPEDPYNKTEIDIALDKAVDEIPIIDAYVRYIGKMQPKPRPGQVEGVEISCPVPGHPDIHPSAWLNLEKKTWYCGGCAVGGDVLDLAAIGQGYAWPDTYKKDGSFHELKEKTASDFGFTPVKLPGGMVIVAEPETSPTPVPNTGEPGESTESGESLESDNSTEADIINLYGDLEEEITVPPIHWDKILVPGTFLDTYMRQVRVDDAPEEFHLFHGLVALGLALGRDVTLFDSIPVYGNLFICVLGRSGSGKSKAKLHLDKLLNQALPYKVDDPNSKGTKKISAAGSAEVLIYNFQKHVPDPTNPKVIAYNAPVRGLIQYNELSALMSRANRMGSALKPALIQLYDMEKIVATSSMTTGLKEATEPFASAITSTQPKALRLLLASSDDVSGFLNRWAFIPGTNKKKFAIGGVSVNVGPAVPPLQEILAWAGTFRHGEQVIWSDEAAVRFTDFFYEVIERDKDRSDNDLIIRIDLLIKKLILLFTANLKLKVVPVEVVEAAISLYPFLQAGFLIPAQEVGKTYISDLQDKIMALALEQYHIDKKGITLRHIGRRLWRQKFSQETISRTVDALVRMDMLTVEKSSPEKSRGRPTIKYKYVDGD